MAAAPTIEPGFHAIHANHLEDLRRAVVYICRQNPMPPLQSETFLVQSNGIAQWLKLALAEKRTEDGVEGGLGIAAGMDFLFPARFIWQAYRAVLPDGEVPEQSPFDKRRLVWRLYRLLPELVGKMRPSRHRRGFWMAATPTCATSSWPKKWQTCSISTRCSGPTGWRPGSRARMW